MYSWIFISLLSFVGPVLSLQVHPRHGNNDAKRIARALDIHADAIFPPHAARDAEIEERGLINGLGTLVNGVLDGVATVVDDTGNVVATILGAGTGSTTTILAANPVTSVSAPQAANPPPAAATQTSTANGNGTPGTTSAASNNNGNVNNGNSGSNNSNAGGSASASGSGNSVSLGSNSPLNAVYTGTFPVLVTDHEGHTHTVTGSGAITLTWVTTLPNGVVSTVTEIITPTVTAEGSSPTNQPTLSPSRIAAIVGTLVTVFLIIFILAFVLLLARKKRKAMQRANSNRDSSMSFGTSDMVHADDTALLHPAASTSSFRTTPCNIDGHKLEFPLPPVPSVLGGQDSSNPGTANSGRPISMGSEGTFDLLERRSRTSLIADRNLFRKIGQYPEAGTYTPFAVAPSSEYNPSEEGHHGGVSASHLSTALASTKSVKNFHEVWRGSKIIDTSAPLPAENPFNDPSPITSPPPAASAPPSSFPGNQRRSGLWRKATFGSSKGAQPSIQKTLDSASDSPAYTTADSSLSADLARGNSLGTQNAARSPGRQTVISLTSSADYETADEAMSMHTSESGGNFSYHSAFTRYANESENPFADYTEGRRGSEGMGSANGSSGKGSSNDSRGGERVMSSSWRPMTAKSTAEFSVMSSSAYSSDANREMGSTPDPKDLFYHPPSTGYTDRPNTGSDRPLTGDPPITAQSDTRGRLSEESGNATSEGEKTIRQTQVSYPSLAEAAAKMQGSSSTWRPAPTR